MYRPIRWLYLKTGIATALVAAVVALRVDVVWAGAFAMGGLVGLLNWYCLGGLFVGLLGKKPAVVFGFLGGKVMLLTSMMLVFLPLFASHAGAFLCGFSMFLLMGTVEGLGMALQVWLKATPGSRALPRDWRALILGTSTDG
ncbi:MAG: hypothetical protein PWP23_1116 [Candidatus Sumerlaeota bacterium]|nr:hypothetical protein [Candidatus Sumerlaeota bacterium]